MDNVDDGKNGMIMLLVGVEVMEDRLLLLHFLLVLWMDVVKAVVDDGMEAIIASSREHARERWDIIAMVEVYGLVSYGGGWRVDENNEARTKATLLLTYPALFCNSGPFIFR